MKKICTVQPFIWSLVVLTVFSCKKDRAITTNHPPIANAGPDLMIILPTNSFMLDGSLSSDPDNNIVIYEWKKIAGPASSAIIPVTGKKEEAFVKDLEKGVYQFELKVTDAKGLFSTDTVELTVKFAPPTRPNLWPPIATAGSDRTLWLPDNSVTLDGSGSFDYEHDITSYQWTKISGPSVFTIADPNSARTQLTDLVEGVYQFELKVTDAGGLFSKDTVNIIVKNAATSSDNPLIADHLVWQFDNTNKRYFMHSPALSTAQISNIKEVALYFHDFPPFGIYVWQPIQKDGTTHGTFYYKIENDRVVTYMNCDSDGSDCHWWMQYVMPQMAIYFN